MVKKFSNKLPTVLQTDTQKEFFAATFDQLFSPAEVKQAQGFIGRRDSGVFNPREDNYLGEPTKLRAAYQLEPIAYAVNAALEDTNEVFYEDLLNYLEYRGGDIGNHDRLFADTFYSFAPPIDVDKYVNYQNYLWLEDGGPIIYIQYAGSLGGTEFDSIIESQIIGATTFNTSENDDLRPRGLDLSSGMRVRFEGSSSWDRPMWIEGVGRDIRLVEELSTQTGGVQVITRPFDNSVIVEAAEGTGYAITATAISSMVTAGRDYQAGDVVSVWSPNNEGVVTPATITVSTVTAGTELSTINGQNETDYDGDPGDGTFTGGTNYQVGDVITLSDGTEVTVNTVVAGVITEFTITSPSVTSFTTASTLTQVSTNRTGFGAPNPEGTGFTLTTDGNNEQAINAIATYTLDSAGDYLFAPNQATSISGVVGSTIAGQTQANFDGLGTNGTFAGGSGYVNGEVITLSDGTVINNVIVSGGEVQTFDINTESLSAHLKNDTLTQASSTGAGTGFSLTLGDANERGTAATFNMTIEGELITVVGGTFTVAATLRPTQVTDPGVIEKVEIVSRGTYSVFPSSPATTTSAGAGTGLQVYLYENGDTGELWDNSVTEEGFDRSVDSDLTLSDYLTIERGSVEGSPWTRTNRWYNVDIVNTAQTLGQIIDATIVSGGINYVVGDQLPVAGDGINGIITVTAVNGAGTITGIRVSGRGQGYTFGGVDQTGAQSLTDTVLWDATDPTPTPSGESWDTSFLWDEVITSGGGQGAIIDITLASATDRSTKAERPILEFRRDLQLFEFGNKYLMEVTVVADNELYADVDGQPAGTVVDGIELKDGMRMIFLDPSQIPNFFEWDDDLPTPNPGASFWDTFAWEAEGASGAVSRFIWQIEIGTSGTISLVKVDPYTQQVDENAEPVPEGGVVVATQGVEFAGRSFYQYRDPVENEFTWREGQQKNGVNDHPLYELYDINAISLADEIEYEGSDFTGNEIFSYRVLTAADIADEGGTLTADAILGFPLTLTGLRQISDIVFENDLETNRVTYNSGEIPGYYFYREWDVDAYGNINLDEVDAPISSYKTNWLASPEPERQRVIDRFLADSDTQDTFTLSARPRNNEERFDIRVNEGRRLNTDEFAYVESLGQIKIFEKPVDTGFQIADGTDSLYSFAGITDPAEVYINNFYEERNIDYNVISTVQLREIEVFDGGTGYAVNDELTLVGGTFNEGRAGKARVVSVAPGGIVTGVFISDIGVYIEAPANPVATTTGGAGVGCLITATFQDATANTFTIQFTETDGVTPRIIPVGEFIEVREQGSGAPGQDSIVEVIYSTLEDINDDDIGFFEIPSGLENNPNNLEIQEQSWADFTPHMVSIIENQAIYLGTAFGSVNNYRDTLKDGSQGEYILQTSSPLLKTMLATSSNELDIVEALRFNGKEYARYKNKFIKEAKNLIDQGFTPFQDGDSIPIDQWVDECIRRIIRSREYADAFEDAYMLAYSTVYEEETYDFVSEVTSGTVVRSFNTVSNFVDLTDKKNAMYVYVDEVIQRVDEDYTISNFNPIEITWLNVPSGTFTITIRLYEDMAPAHIPATPQKLGLAPIFIPRVVTDNSYRSPISVLVNHDGSRTPLYGDYRDDLLYEWETRIYNGILDQFRNDYDLPLEEDTFKPGRFRSTRWDNVEWNALLRPNFFKWVAASNADYITNEFYDASDPWTWNYSEVVGTDGEGLPGYWRGIFDQYYDTQTPHVTPWEMLGFTEEPSWWATEYTSGPWINTSPMWTDLQNGVIRDGYRAGTDERYARPGLTTNSIPVDEFGVLLSTPLECIANDNSLTLPSTVQAAKGWVFGDWAPVEYAWRIGEEYSFAVSEALFLARPGEYGEQFWDPEHTFFVPANTLQVVSNDNSVYKRVGNDTLTVHGETISGVKQVNTGWQVWVSSRLRALGKDLGNDFGQKVRTLDVKLGHKMGAFTNKDTMSITVEGISVTSLQNNLLIPQENINVSLHTGAPVREYVYGGVLVRAQADGTFQLFGYDILGGEFNYIPRVDAHPRNTNINVGGQPEKFTQWQAGTTYQQYDIVRFNSIYYRALETHTAESSFDQSLWSKLSKLPTTGGIDVTYKPVGQDSVAQLQYGETLATAQEVFDIMIGYGAWLESEGWKFENKNPESGQVETWLESAKQFLLWTQTNWEANSIVMISPAATGATLLAQEGYPAAVEKIVNGVYSILSKEGVAIDPRNTIIKREDRQISILPAIEQVGIYGARINTTETESIITFDNTTDFNDIIYDPLLGARLARVSFNGRYTTDWTGKLEAGGYIITEDGLIPNFENMVDSIRFYHDTETILDNPDKENAARHLIGFSERDYYSDLDIQNDSQYQFYQGAIRQKGTVQSIRRLERSTRVGDATDDTEVFEEWALKTSEFGNVCGNQSIEFFIQANEVKVDPQLVKLVYPSNMEIIRTEFLGPSDISGGAFLMPAHGYTTGELVFVTLDGNAPTGLTNNTIYSVIVVDSNTIQLAEVSTPNTPITVVAPVNGTSALATLASNSTTSSIIGYEGLPDVIVPEPFEVDIEEAGGTTETFRLTEFNDYGMSSGIGVELTDFSAPYNSPGLEAISEVRITHSGQSNRFDINSAGLEASFNPSIANSPWAAFGQVGYKLYVVDTVTNGFKQYSLTTAYDTTTATLDGTYDIDVAEAGMQWGIFSEFDGLSSARGDWFLTFGTTSNRMKRWGCSTDWDLNTASFDTQSEDVTTWAEVPNLNGGSIIVVDPGVGYDVYWLDGTLNQIQRWDGILNVAFNLTEANKAADINLNSLTNFNFGTPTSMMLAEAGDKLIILDTNYNASGNTYLCEIPLNTRRDLTTIDTTAPEKVRLLSDVYGTETNYQPHLSGFYKEKRFILCGDDSDNVLVFNGAPAEASPLILSTADIGSGGDMDHGGSSAFSGYLYFWFPNAGGYWDGKDVGDTYQITFVTADDSTYTLNNANLGTVTSIDIVSDTNTVYSSIPTVTLVNHPDDIMGQDATAIAVLDTDSTLLRIDITNGGYGYMYPPTVYIGDQVIDTTDDRAVAILTYDIDVDDASDDIILIDVDDNVRWPTKPTGIACNIVENIFPVEPRTDNQYITSATVAAGGTGYAVSDVLTLQGGNATVPATLTVTQVSAGAITNFTLNGGRYITAPTGTVAVTGGTGSGGTVNVTVDTRKFTDSNARKLPNAGNVSINDTQFSFVSTAGLDALATLASPPSRKGETINVAYGENEDWGVYIMNNLRLHASELLIERQVDSEDPIYTQGRVYTNINLASIGEDRPLQQATLEYSTSSGSSITKITVTDSGYGYWEDSFITISDATDATVSPDGYAVVPVTSIDGQFALNIPQQTIATQQETAFRGIGNEGTFAGGTGHANSDQITMSDGTVVIVNNNSGGAVTEFTISVASTTSFNTLSTLTQVSSTGGGSGFTLSLGGANAELVSALGSGYAAVADASPASISIQDIPGPKQSGRYLSNTSESGTGKFYVNNILYDYTYSGAQTATAVSIVGRGVGYAPGDELSVNGGFSISSPALLTVDSIRTITGQSHTDFSGASVGFTNGTFVGGADYNDATTLFDSDDATGRPTVPASEIVNVTDDDIYIASHGYTTGDAVVLRNGGTVPGGLAADTVYYVIRIDDGLIQLATTAANATSGVAIDLTTTGSGVHSFSDTIVLDDNTLITVDTVGRIPRDAQTQALYNGAGDNGTFEAGRGYVATDTITLEDGTIVTVDAVSGLEEVIVGQTHLDFQGGNFTAGAAHDVGDIITMSDGSTVEIKATSAEPGPVTEFEIITGTVTPFLGGANLTQSSSTGQGTGFELNTSVSVTSQEAGDVTSFTVDSSAAVGTVSPGTAITQTSTSTAAGDPGAGTGFTLTLGNRWDGVDGNFDVATGGQVNEFTIYTSGSAISSIGTTQRQAATTAGGTGFELTLGTANEEILDFTLTTGGDYSVLPVGTVTVNGGAGSGATFTLDTFNPLYDITKDGTAVEDATFADDTEFFVLTDIRYRNTTNRDNFANEDLAAGIRTVWIDDNGEGLWEVQNVFAPLIVSQTEADFDSTWTVSSGDHGTFFGGASHVALDVVTLSNNATVRIDTVGDEGVATEFTILTVGDPVQHGDTLEQIDTTGIAGIAFSITVDSHNLDETSITYTQRALQDTLIDSKLFKQAYVYEESTGDTIAQLPVYDPFKGIIPGNADLNLSWKARRDPARYNNAADATLLSDTRLFDSEQEGLLWWDLSTCAYLYYEQGDDTYRRDNWGALINGSSIDIYEWTRSSVTPANYEGDGTVRSTTEYTQVREYDRQLEETRTYYYFWVKNRTVVPEGVERTLAAFEVANLLSNPAAQLYQWFAPVSQSGFMFAGIEGSFTDSDNIVQINYRRTEQEKPRHVEWQLGREGDPDYYILDKHWNKMVDSLCGFTDLVAIGNNANTDIVATFQTQSGVASGTEVITTDAPHGFSTGNGVYYSVNGGVDTVGLTDGVMYYVNVISDNTLSLHATRTNAVGDASRIDVTSAGTEETHRLSAPTTALNNFKTALPSAADTTQGYLIVPDPTLSDTERYGIETRPLQTMFVNKTQARKLFVEKVNELMQYVNLRDENPTWNSSMTTNTLWEWVDWYEVGYNATNAIPTFQVSSVSDMDNITQIIDEDIVRVTGTRWRLYQYDEDTDNFVLIGREASRLNLLTDIYTSVDNLDDAIELRELITALKDNVFTTDREINTNLVFFAMLNYVFSEQDDLDWAFKTTYIYLKQQGRTLQQERVYQNDPFDSALEFINEFKPYQTKVRDFRTERAAEIDLVPGTAEELTRNFNIDMVYDRFRGGDLSIAEMRIAKNAAIDNRWDGYTTKDGGSTLVRLGAAGRMAGMQNDLMANVADIDSDVLAAYTTAPVQAVIQVTVGGAGNITGATVISGGQGYYSAGSFVVTLATGAGGNDNAVVNYQVDTVNKGAILNTLTVLPQGSGYTPGVHTIAAADMPDFTSVAITEAEITAIAAINERITNTFAYDYEGLFLQNTEFTGNPTLISATIATAGTGYTVGDIVTLDAGSGTPITNAQFRVEAVDGGNGITSLLLINGGSYQQTPTVDPVDLNGGTGSGAQVTNLLFETGSTVPFDSTPHDQIGWDSSVFDPSVSPLEGTPLDLYRTIINQTHVNFDGNLTGEGSFVGGSGYVVNEIISMNDGTEVRVDTVDGGGAVTQFTIIGGSTTSNISEATLIQTLSKIPPYGAGDTGAGTLFALTLGTANQSSANFFDVPPEETFNGTGSQKEFTLTTTVPTVFLFVVVDGVEQRLNVDYFFIADELYFPTAPALGTNNIQVYTYIEAGDLINPQVRAGVTEEMVPLDPRENLVLRADTSAQGATLTSAVSLTYVAGSPATITRGSGDFTSDGIVDGQTIYVSGTPSNDGYYDVVTAEALTLTLADKHTLTAETASSSILDTTTVSFTIHEDTQQGINYYRNADSASTTLTAAIQTNATEIPITTHLPLDPVPDWDNPVEVWIGTELVQYHGVQGIYTWDYLSIDDGGTGYTTGDVLTVVGNTTGQATNSTITITATAGIIDGVTSDTIGTYKEAAVNPVAVLGGTIAAQTELDFNGTSPNGTFSGGTGFDAGDIGGTITMDDGTTITIDNVVAGAVTEFTVATNTTGVLVQDSNGTTITLDQDSVSVGVGTGFVLVLNTANQTGNSDATFNITSNNVGATLVGCRRGYRGTHPQAHASGDKVFATQGQTFPNPETFWTIPVSLADYAGTDGEWRFVGVTEGGFSSIHFYDNTDNLFSANVTVGEALDVTHATVGQEYLVTDIIATGELSIIDITAAGTGYAVGDVIDIHSVATGGTGVTAEVGAVDGNGGIVYVRITARGSGYTDVGAVAVTATEITSTNGAGATMSVYFDREALECALPNRILDVNGIVAAVDTLTWQVNGLTYSIADASNTDVNAVFLQAQPGNAL
jgi:hypothetical protein